MYYVDDPDQLPELPDPGPRDGRHGVDRDNDFDPYPARHFGNDTGGDLTVSIEDARWHLGVLLDRVQAGEEIMLTRGGRPVALLVAPSRKRRGSGRATRPGDAVAARAVTAQPAAAPSRSSAGRVSDRILGAVAASAAAAGRKRPQPQAPNAPAEPPEREASDEPLFFPLTR
jgi:prevent-host-death family protein